MLPLRHFLYRADGAEDSDVGTSRLAMFRLRLRSTVRLWASRRGVSTVSEGNAFEPGETQGPQ